MDEINQKLAPGRAYRHDRPPPGVAGPWSVATSTTRFLADANGFTAFFKSEEAAVAAYQQNSSQSEAPAHSVAG